jgi:hypothetical protein
MDADERIVVIPDARSRTRLEVEAAALFVLNDSTEPLSTAEVGRRMTPAPSRDTVLRALTALAEKGDAEREPPIAQAAERRIVTWRSASADQLRLPQNSIPRTVEFAAADGVAADTAGSAAVTPIAAEVLQ